MLQKRIEGLEKVTGAKIFARDFRPRDLGWTDDCWHVLLLRAKHADRPLDRVDENTFEASVKPDKIIVAADLAALKIKSLEQDKQPKFGKYWLVEPNQTAEYVGQVVAILYYKSADMQRKAVKWLRENDKVAIYKDAPLIHAEDDIRRLVDPLLAELQKASEKPYGSKHYVRIAGLKETDDDEFAFTRPLLDKNTGKPILDPKGNEYKLHDLTKLSKILEKDENQRQRNLEARNAVDKIELAIDENGWPSLDRTFYTQSTDPVFLEPESGLAWWQPDSKSLHIVYGTQSPKKDIQNIAEIFSDAVEPMKNSHVEYVACYPGGGFGGRDESNFPLYLALAAVFADVPVRLAYDRFEQFQCGVKCHAAVVQNRLAYNKDDGAPHALLSTVLLDGGGELNLTLAVAGLAALQAAGIYKIPRTAISSVGYRTKGSPAGSLRGFGIPPVTFAVESMMDEIAVTLKQDPVEFRARHAMKKGDRDVTGCALNNNLANVEILEHAKTEDLWTKRHDEKSKRDRSGLAYGVGFAVCMESFGTSRDAIYIEIGFDAEGKLKIWSCGVDMGQGTATALAKVTEIFFGVAASEVVMGEAGRFDHLGLHTSTAPAADKKRYTPKLATAQSASVTAFYHLHAAEEACKVLLDHGLRPAAAKIWGESAENARWENGAMKLDGKSDLSFAELVRVAHENDLITSAMIHTYFQVRFATAEYAVDGVRKTRLIDALGVRRAGSEQNLEFIERIPEQAIYPTDADRNYQRSLYASVGHIIAVEVHTNSGQIDVVDAVTILDAGDVHHRELLAGQAEGGFAMGISHTLYEDVPPAPVGTDGGWNLHRYQLARANQIPLGRMKLVTLPLSEASILADGTPVRKKGIAEAVLSTVSPAIHNAVAHAVGVRINSLPMTPERVTEALAQK